MALPEWIKPALLGCGFGAIAITIIGFTWGGWVTGSKAEVIASERARAEVVQALVPVCVARSVADPNAASTMAALKEAATYRRDDVVMDAGWATMPGEDNPSRPLALACIDKIMGTT
ncbi:hypothetical protein [Nisaea sediminum]|uniref:hypothetical protein n=1 Tax=Nisaea sediminum TaxID=2775867 RepID=UPI001865F7BD|nr:hypothetical protein [Nisaea sediminum]